MDSRPLVSQKMSMNPSKASFVPQTRSRPVSIINPASRENQLRLAQKAQDFGLKASKFPSTDSSNVFLESASGQDEPGISPLEARQCSKLQLDDDEVEPGFNVYARAFVPDSLVKINNLDGHVINTPPGRRINFEAYVRSCFGLDFLPHLPEPVDISEHPIPNFTEDIQTQYEQRIRRQLQDEINAQEKENASYSLYEHDVTVKDHGIGVPASCSFHVPGLRENSPYIEEGDVIQLRQLRYDHRNQPYGTEQWPAPIFSYPRYPSTGYVVPGERWPRQSTPSWTGVIYNGRVAAVQRKEEQLIVKVTGLDVQNLHFSMVLGNPYLKFNITFPVQMDRYMPMIRVLPIIQQTLSGANQDPSLRVNNTTTSRRHWIESMLFPSEANNEKQTKLNPGFIHRPFFDRELNWEQQKAVESICCQNYGSLPFLISGPPGTGKTKTLVETALQLIHNVDKVSHILVCAPSDPAADILAQRLSVHLRDPCDLLRLNRISRTFAEVPSSLLPYCYIAQDTFCLPDLKHLMAFKIVVTTCRDSALLLYARMSNSDLYAAESGLLSALHPSYSPPLMVKPHWTALLIDEAAQALEPEALIPLAVVSPPEITGELDFRPLVVMAGDEYQLGPRTSLRTSPLKTSLFARLFARPVYAKHPLARGETGKAPPTLTNSMLPICRPAFANLIRNYRSHPAILAVPSWLFYKDTLEPEATNTHRLKSWLGWQGKKWPVLFHNNSSPDDLETDGGGWYNNIEAQIACQYALQLTQTGLVSQKEICIMSPFKAQVACIRKNIRQSQFGALWEVDIGPMEAFQGLESGVVILCTTRSKQRFVSKDKELDWGIVGMPNKMNVALTRAKFGLIVIGKKSVLAQDPNWNAWLQFCDRNGLLSGETDGIRIVRHGKLTRLEKVLINKERDENQDVNDGVRQMGVYPQEDEMWTQGMAATLEMESVDAVLQLEDDERDNYEDEE
jgi:hypothetical protein